MRSPLKRFRHSFVVATVGGLLAIGCGAKPVPADPEKARSVLRVALDHWKDGNSANALKERTPPIQMFDYRWQEGCRLSRYEVGEDVRSHGFDFRCRVKLWLMTDKGEFVESASYTISTSPALTVVRDAGSV